MADRQAYRLLGGFRSAMAQVLRGAKVLAAKAADLIKLKGPGRDTAAVRRARRALARWASGYQATEYQKGPTCAPAQRRLRAALRARGGCSTVGLVAL